MNLARAYVHFVFCELRETGGAALFQVHHQAPSDMTRAQLEYFAGALRDNGWRADVAPIEPEDETSLGLRIRNWER